MAKIGSLTADLRLESASFIRDLRKAAQETSANTNRMTRQMQGLQRSTQNVSRAFGDLRRLLAAYVGLNAVRNFVQTADAAKQLEGQLRLVTNSSQELADTQAKLFDLAQRSRASLEGTVNLYARLARSTQELDASQADLLTVTEAVNNAIVVSGSSASAADAAIVQLGQGFASGVLRGEELNSVLEQTPRLAQAIAEGLGISLGQLRAFGKEGKLTSEAVFGALLSQSEQLRAEFQVMPRTVSQALTQLNNEWIRVVSGANEASGATDELVKAIDQVRAVIGSQAFISALATVAKGFAAVAENMGLVVAAGGAIVGGRLGSALLGRLGAIAGAVAGGTEAWLAYKRSLDAAKKSIEELEKANSEGAGAGFAGLGGASLTDKQIARAKLDIELMQLRNKELEAEVAGNAALALEFGKSLAILRETKALREGGQGELADQMLPLIERELQLNEALRYRKELIDGLQTPWENYGETLRKIDFLHRAGAVSAQKAVQLQAIAAGQLASTYGDAIGSVAGALSGLFQENKSLAIATATINTLVGITKAFELPFPLNFAQAAAVSVAGFAQVAKIRSTSPGGGGGGRGGLSGGGSGATSFRSSSDTFREADNSINRAGGVPEPVPVQRSVNVTLMGNGYSKQDIRDLIDQINDEIGDGAQIRVSS